MENMLVRPVHVKAQSVDQAKGLATFVVSVYGNEDLGGDVVMPGAFKTAISSQKRLPKFAPNHDLSVEKRLGKVTAWRDTSEGLEIDAQFNLQKQLAREVFSDFVFDPGGQEFSFSYDIAPGGSKIEKGIRYLTKISEVMDVGPVGMGMNPETRLVAVKENETASTNTSAGTAFVTILPKFVDAEGKPFDWNAVGAKAGRVISAKTESRIRDAISALEDVLASSEAQAPSESANGSGKADEPVEAKADDFPRLAELTKGWKALTGQKDEEGNGE